MLEGMNYAIVKGSFQLYFALIIKNSVYKPCTSSQNS